MYGNRLPKGAARNGRHNGTGQERTGEIINQSELLWQLFGTWNAAEAKSQKAAFAWCPNKYEVEELPRGTYPGIVGIVPKYRNN